MCSQSQSIGAGVSGEPTGPRTGSPVETTSSASAADAFVQRLGVGRWGGARKYAQSDGGKKIGKVNKAVVEDIVKVPCGPLLAWPKADAAAAVAVEPSTSEEQVLSALMPLLERYEAATSILDMTDGEVRAVSQTQALLATLRERFPSAA